MSCTLASIVESLSNVTFLVKGVPSTESSRSVRGLGKGVSGKPYPRLCNARRLRLEPGTFLVELGNVGNTFIIRAETVACVACAVLIG